MGSASTISSTTAKTASIAASLLSSISSSFSSGQVAADGLFSDILTQNQPPPAPPQQQNTNPQGGQTSSSQTGPSSAQNAGTNNSQNNSTNSGTQATNHPAVSHKGQDAGKVSHHHDAKQGGDKNKPDDTNNNPAVNAAAAVQTNVSANTSTNSTSATVTAAASTTQNDTAGNNDPANSNSNTNNDPANPPVLAADLNIVSAAPAPVVPAAPQMTDPSPAVNDNANSGTPASNGDMSASQLMLALMQLEHLTASAQLTATTAFNANVQTGQNPNATASSAGTDNTKGQIDLKALLAAVAKSNGVNFLGSDTSQTNGTNAVGDSQNTAGATNAAPATQAPQQAANSSQTQQAPADKWMNANFVNLFNLANADQNNNAVPLALNALINPGATPDNSDGASLDDGGQGQNETGSHDLAANAPLNTNLPQTAGPTQAASPYDFASQLSAMRATKGGPTGLPTPVEQVMLQLSRGLSKDGPTQMTIQLRPAELGRIDVKLNVDSSGKVQGTVTADNPATLGLLLKDVRGLERALQEAGLRADSGSLQFNLRGDGQTGGSFNQTANNSSGSSGSSSSEAQTSLPVFVDQAETYYLTPGGVNMRV